MFSYNYATNTITISSSAGPTALSDLNDIEILNPQDGETLVYDSATEKWINSSPTASIAADDILVGEVLTALKKE